MPLGDVTNFMSNDARQLGLGFQVGQQPTVDVDVAAGQGEGVDIGRVQYGKTKMRIGHRRIGYQSLADVVDVGGQLGIVIDTNGLDHFPILFGGVLGKINLSATDGDCGRGSVRRQRAS